MDIAEVADTTGLSASTLRYYETRGLIRSTGRNGLRRQYHESVIERLSLVNLGRRAGFSLDEISEMLTPAGKLQINRTKLREKASSLDDEIRQLQAIRDMLVHVAECRAPSHLQCPKFRKLMRVGGKKPA